MCDQSNKLRDKLNLAPSGPALPEEKDTAWVHANATSVIRYSAPRKNEHAKLQFPL